METLGKEVTTLKSSALAVPGKSEVVLSHDVKLKFGSVLPLSSIFGGLGGTLAFLLTGLNVELIPVAAGIAAALTGGFAFIGRYGEFQDQSPKSILKDMPLRNAIPSFSRKETRTPYVSFGVHDPVGKCMTEWVTTEKEVPAGNATHFITHYAIGKGTKVRVEQEVSQSLGALWDSSMDAIAEVYDVYDFDYQMRHNSYPS